MTTTRLLAHSVEKPWGRVDIPSAVAPSDGRRIGEIWFSPPEGGAGRPLPLLVKYIFTSEKLSVQVHPMMRRSEEHTSELQSLMRISYAVFCLNKTITHEIKAQT